jgi:hypothetical protein
MSSAVAEPFKVQGVLAQVLLTVQYGELLIGGWVRTVELSCSSRNQVKG